jgi:ABC-type bacteriocin/lantibiotic exporter with double-glycine peptidase domain
LVFWIYAFILTFVAVATSLLSVLVVRMNRPFFRRRR